MTAYDIVARHIERHHPRFSTGLAEARTVRPERYDAMAGAYLEWLRKAHGDSGLEAAAEAYVRFTANVNIEQARYEARGRYSSRTFKEVEKAVYGQHEKMSDYLLGSFLTNFLWAHHVELCYFFEDRFVSSLGDDARIVEIAFGHGGWGQRALGLRSRATVEGYDLSSAAVELATRLAGATGLESRTRYHLGDGTELPSTIAPADATICCFLMEHLEDPLALLRALHRVTRDDGVVFMTAGLEAAHTDHIFEYHRESEIVLQCEESGFRVREMLSVSPRRKLPNARFLPRSAAFVLEKAARPRA